MPPTTPTTTTPVGFNYFTSMASAQIVFLYSLQLRGILIDLPSELSKPLALVKQLLSLLRLFTEHNPY